MDTEDIEKLIRLLSETDVAELEWEEDGSRLVLRKAQPQAVPVPAAPPAPAAGAAQPPATAAQPAESAEDPAEKIDSDRLVEVMAPMVGTFYRAPAPDAPPFVEEGDEIDVGTPLCIIEAMKLMNEIESEVKGRIVKILVENAQPIEYGQPLFLVEKR